VPTLNLKDPDVHRLAAELSRKRGVSMTAAVRDALAEALERREAEVQARIDRIMAAARASAARPEPFLTDEDLYDENGLPR
jgi:antitoxin VapB